MSFDLLNQLGLSGLDYSYIFIGLAVISFVLMILVIVQMIQINNLKKNYKKFMGGKDIKSLEKLLEKIVEDHKMIVELSDEHRDEIKNINKRLENSFSKVGIVKYDAFKQMGGLLSFSLALLNEKDSGFVINSVHSTEGCYTYIKEVTAGICEMDLSNEEKELFAKYASQSSEFLCVSNADSFISGFRLGARFTYDTFVTD